MAEGRSDKRSRRLAAGCVGVALAVVAAGCSTASATGTPATTEPAPTIVPSTKPAPRALGALTTYGYGNARSDRDTVDPTIAKLSSAPKWDDSLDGAVYGQPLVYNAAVYVGTENDTIYAIKAKTGKVLWRLHVGTAVSTSAIDTAPGLSGGCGDIDPLGITGTPVIDTARSLVPCCCRDLRRRRDRGRRQQVAGHQTLARRRIPHHPRRTLAQADRPTACQLLELLLHPRRTAALRPHPRRRPDLRRVRRTRRRLRPVPRLRR